jgi:uncharacterized membrane protein YphA (DoxX/SURF4 family)
MTTTTTRTVPAQNSWTRFLGWLGLAGRLYLGYIFITAGLDKLPHYDATKNAVTAYQLMPWRWISTYALLLPVAELLLGVLLVLGIFTRSAAVLLALGLCSFLVGITSVWVRGLSINCGCFGGGGATTDPHYLEHVLRDSGYLAIAVYLILVRRTRLAVGEWLFGHRD